jgi:hypothetical protein
MESFCVSVCISRELPAVRHALWHLEDWPAIAPHVLAVEVEFACDDVQVVWMTVLSRGNTDRFRSVRIRQDDAIFYFQPRPPAFLRRHYGWWILRTEGGQTIVDSRHELELNPEEAGQYLAATGSPPASCDDAQKRIVDLIRHNSTQTMLGLKRKLEPVREAAHVAH